MRKVWRPVLNIAFGFVIAQIALMLLQPDIALLVLGGVMCLGIAVAVCVIRDR